MKIVRTIAEMRAARTGRIAFVPTMGAFHEGHLDLMRQARSEAGTVVVSLFVNPTQFGPNEDFNRYPRNESRDFDLAREAGVDILFAPTPEEMYRRVTTIITVKGVSDLWEGAHRPNHFEGVATVVCKLFNIVQPDVSLFGLKDLQQCAVITRMVEDLNIPVELRLCNTFREPDGLAMSSRNAFLSEVDRAKAPYIYRELLRCSTLFRTGQMNKEQVQRELLASTNQLQADGFQVDYFALVDSKDMASQQVPCKGHSIIAAARIGNTRLIDNVQI